MLAKKYRLPIQSVLNKSGQTFRSRSFLIKVFSNQLEFNRFGVVISKKVSKLAVKRNLLKRMVLDAAKKFVSDENKNKFDILIIISPAMIKMEKADIIKELEESLQKILNV
ncbi:MAG: ribonuclease P protein component [bacterium]|nr:ribonuclease P protein component [bacterium]